MTAVQGDISDGECDQRAQQARGAGRGGRRPAARGRPGRRQRAREGVRPISNSSPTADAPTRAPPASPGSRPRRRRASRRRPTTSVPEETTTQARPRRRPASPRSRRPPRSRTSSRRPARIRTRAARRPAAERRRRARQRRRDRRRERGLMNTTISDRYELGDRLGSGGMSTVYRATDRVLERTVAVKILAEHLSDDDKFVARFRREALAVAKLIHPNIVQVYDTGRRRRPPLHRHGVRRGQVGRPAAADQGPPRRRRHRRDRDPGVRRARVRAPPGDHPPRRQARAT